MRLQLLAAAALGSILAGCGTDTPSAGPERKPNVQTDGAKAGQDCRVEGSAVEISAAKSKFDKACLAVKAGVPFKITMNNADVYGHNFSILERKGASRIFEGDVFEGPKSMTYEVPGDGGPADQPGGEGPTAPGVYHFQCDIHPGIMNGKFIIK